MECLLDRDGQCYLHSGQKECRITKALRAKNASLEQSLKEAREALQACATSLQWLHGDRNLKEWVDEKGAKQDPCGIRSSFQMAIAALAGQDEKKGSEK